MPKPYSNDLRKRLVAAVEGGLSRHQAAAQFEVSPSTAVNWVKRARQTGSVEPGQMGGHRPRAIRGADEAWLSARLRERDFTLRGLVVDWSEPLCSATIWVRNSGDQDDKL
jgi:transposase